jgi:hypothetical protein
MDTCHAGEVDDDEAPKLAEGVVARDPGATARGARVGSTRPPRTLDVGRELMRNWFAELRRESGTTVIAAAGGREYALESGQWNNGVFTWSLLDGLKNRTADQDGDGAITSAELLDYTSRKVAELTGGQQVPTARRENLSAFIVAQKPEDPAP